MQIATWNIAPDRTPAPGARLAGRQSVPQPAGLKLTDDVSVYALKDAGYEAAAFGQKTTTSPS